MRPGLIGELVAIAGKKLSLLNFLSDNLRELSGHVEDDAFLSGIDRQKVYMEEIDSIDMEYALQVKELPIDLQLAFAFPIQCPLQNEYAALETVLEKQHNALLAISSLNAEIHKQAKTASSGLQERLRQINRQKKVNEHYGLNQGLLRGSLLNYKEREK